MAIAHHSAHNTIGPIANTISSVRSEKRGIGTYPSTLIIAIIEAKPTSETPAKTTMHQARMVMISWRLPSHVGQIIKVYGS